MKRSIYIIIITLVICGCKNTDTKEYFVRPMPFICEYPFNDTIKFAVTCRVWGLLKYYHPNVTAGKLDWDKVLLDRLYKINNAQTPETVNKELIQMIYAAGKYKLKAKDNSWNDSLNMNVNLCWLDRSFINDTIKQELRKIASLTVKQPSYYVDNIYTGSLTFTNEKDYDNLDLLYFDYRLLSLFRYWNVIYYFFPYKYLMDQPWDVTLNEFIPKFINADNPRIYKEVVMMLTTRLNDGHGFSSILPSVDNFQNNITMINTQTVVRTPPEQSLLKRGDIILSINGRDIKTMRDSIETFIPSSNRHYTNNMINAYINKIIRDGCFLTLSRNHQLLNIVENKKTLLQKTNDTFKIISKNIGYVNLGWLEQSNVNIVMDSLRNNKGIIFDLRNYPNSCNACWEVCCHLKTVPISHYGRGILSDLSHCGAYYERNFFIKLLDKKIDIDVYKGKAIVLINAKTMSAAETMAMLFRNNGLTLIGTPTAGANGDIATLLLPGKITAYFSSIGYYYPDGKEMQRIGIIPDIEVFPTMESIIYGKDEILERAITYIQNLK